MDFFLARIPLNKDFYCENSIKERWFINTTTHDNYTRVELMNPIKSYFIRKRGHPYTDMEGAHAFIVGYMEVGSLTLPRTPAAKPKTTPKRHAPWMKRYGCEVAKDKTDECS